MQSDAETVGPLNLGNRGETTMLELATKVIELTNSDSELLHKPLPSDDPTQRCPDTSLAEELIGWSPKVDLATGSNATIKYFDELIRNTQQAG